MAVLLLLLLSWPYLGLAEIWPPDGRLKPNNYIPPPVCQYVQEEVQVGAVEETCTTAPVEECGQQEVQRQEERTESECHTVTEEECQQVEEGEECQPQECPEECHQVVEESCQVEYTEETKEECSYSTVMDKKCSLSYEVTYRKSCTPSLHCSLLGLACRQVGRCRQVPHLPRPVTCHRVPRQVGPRCRQVPVKRPLHTCTPVTTLHCSRDACEQTRVCTPRVSRVCTPVQRERCTQVTALVPVFTKERLCRSVAKKTCEKKEVSRPKMVNKRVCRELSDKEKEEGEEKGEHLTAYVNLENTN